MINTHVLNSSRKKTSISSMKIYALFVVLVMSFKTVMLYRFYKQKICNFYDVGYQFAF